MAQGLAWEVREGDSRDLMRAMPDASVDAIVCDPPYELGFMGKRWDSTGIAYSVDLWREALRVLKPGGHLLAFGGTRTYHRMACAIEDAGFEIRDSIHWMYGSGFPKSLDVSKAIDKAAGAEREVAGSRVLTGRAAQSIAEKGGTYTAAAPSSAGLVKEVPVTAPATDSARQWSGWGTALKPAHEPVVMARRPLDGTVAANVLAHGTGAINVDGCRVGTDTVEWAGARGGSDDATQSQGRNYRLGAGEARPVSGRWPANVLLLHAQGCRRVGVRRVENGEAKFAQTEVITPAHEGYSRPGRNMHTHKQAGHRRAIGAETIDAWECADGCPVAELGDAARYYYTAKPSTAERDAGLEHLPVTPGHEVCDREDGSAGADHARAGVRTQRRNIHPTVKPIAIMRYLVRLVTPPGGLVLDPFAGSGTTGCAAVLEGARFLGLELEPKHAEIARARIAHWAAQAPTQGELWPAASVAS